MVSHQPVPALSRDRSALAQGQRKVHLSSSYETVVVVDAMIPDESIQSEFDAISKFIETQGKLIRMDRWGKRRLAYSVRKKSHGEYAVFYYEESGALPAELEKRFRINENILRWLTVANNPAGIPELKNESIVDVVEALAERKGE